MSKYAKLDGLIVNAVLTGHFTFTELQQHDAVRDEADMRDTGTGFDRVIDRRLQALRKAGRIRYAAGKWEVVGEKRWIYSQARAMAKEMARFVIVTFYAALVGFGLTTGWIYGMVYVGSHL